jgi:tetratricopeptide (TPR) repeat protein
MTRGNYCKIAITLTTLLGSRAGIVVGEIACLQQLLVDCRNSDGGYWLGARWHLIAGRLLGRLGRHRSAARQFELAIALSPQHLRAHLWLGWSFFQLKQYDKAIFAFEQALQIAPDSAYAHAYGGLSCSHLGRY